MSNELDLFSNLDERLEESIRDITKDIIFESEILDSDEKIEKVKELEEISIEDEDKEEFLKGVVGPIMEASGFLSLDEDTKPTIVDGLFYEMSLALSLIENEQFDGIRGLLEASGVKVSDKCDNKCLASKYVSLLFREWGIKDERIAKTILEACKINLENVDPLNLVMDVHQLSEISLSEYFAPTVPYPSKPDPRGYPYEHPVDVAKKWWGKNARKVWDWNKEKAVDVPKDVYKPKIEKVEKSVAKAVGMSIEPTAFAQKVDNTAAAEETRKKAEEDAAERQRKLAQIRADAEKEDDDMIKVLDDFHGATVKKSEKDKSDEYIAKTIASDGTPTFVNPSPAIQNASNVSSALKKAAAEETKKKGLIFGKETVGKVLQKAKEARGWLHDKLSSWVSPEFASRFTGFVTKRNMALGLGAVTLAAIGVALYRKWRNGKKVASALNIVSSKCDATKNPAKCRKQVSELSRKYASMK